MPKPVCVPCRRFFRPSRNGIALIEGMPIGNDAKPGLEEPDRWQPYKLWRADLWVCRGCGAEIVVGFGSMPVAVHHQEGFAERLHILDTLLQVNDC